jgi:hypothetical protein
MMLYGFARLAAATLLAFEVLFGAHCWRGEPSQDFGNRSVVMTAIVKVLPEPPVGLHSTLRVFLRMIG